MNRDRSSRTAMIVPEFPQEANQTPLPLREGQGEGLGVGMSLKVRFDRPRSYSTRQVGQPDKVRAPNICTWNISS